jgi:hypothetical protein
LSRRRRRGSGRFYVGGRWGCVLPSCPGWGRGVGVWCALGVLCKLKVDEAEDGAAARLRHDDVGCRGALGGALNLIVA